MLVAQSCLTLCNRMDCSPPGSSAHGIIPVRILKWVAISFSRVFPTQGLNSGLPHCRQILYHWATCKTTSVLLKILWVRNLEKAHITWVLSCSYSQMLAGAARLWKLDRLDMQNNSFTKLIVIVGFLLGIHLSCWTGVCPYMTFLSCGSQHSWTFCTMTQGSISQCPDHKNGDYITFYDSALQVT